VLTEIRFVDALPRTSVGKIDKKEIRRRIAEA
jgi:non-ribosomal peptide synthetase component E (peptide arylation enzyme)